MTEALYKKLKTKGQIACVLGHEIGHVVARHSAEEIAKEELMEGLTGAAVLATYNPDDPKSKDSAEIAKLIGKLVTLRYGREQELQSDKLGVRLASQAGYDPRSMIRVMAVLKSDEEEPEEGSEENVEDSEFFSTHPNFEKRDERINEAIKELYPQGVPEGLIK